MVLNLLIIGIDFIILSLRKRMSECFFSVFIIDRIKKCTIYN
jgi:hypothetical protein